MKNLRVSILAALILIGLGACNKEEQSQNQLTNNAQVESSFDMVVPDGFNFETTESVNLQLNLEDAPTDGKYLLKVYVGNPSAAAKPIFQGFMERGVVLNQDILLPAGLQQLNLVMQAPDGSSFLTVLPKSASIKHTFYRSKNKSAKNSSFSGPNCNSGCDYTINLNSSLTADEDEETYCVIGSYNGNADITIREEAIVRLCGTGTIRTINVNKGTLAVLSGANVTVNNLNLNSSSDNELIVYQGGSLTITNWFTPNADITNYGNINVAALNLNSGCDLENHGTFIVSTNNHSNFNGDVENYGTMTINGNAAINGGSEWENYCNVTFGGNLTMNEDVENYSFIKVTDKWTINGGSKLEMEDGAMAVCEDLLLNGRIEGEGSTSLFKVLDRSDINGGAQIKKNIQFCDANGIETNWANNLFRNGAAQGCSLVINTSPCNPEGNGVAVVADADNDGVADELDAYPNDASRAADSYFPSENEYGTLAFEDLWPSFGDYDFNDLVVDYRYQQVLNADNDVVDLKAVFVTRAMGGALKNGFGFQLDLASNTVNSVSGTRDFNSLITTNANGTESDQTKAVVIVYDDASQVLVNNTGQAFANTISANPKIPNDTVEIVINFNNPVSVASLGTAPYNPFIFVDQTRGREVHLAGEAPTDLADATLFGTRNDNTNPNSDNTYKSENNLPWAIHVVGGFSYPEEKVDIADAYTYFSTWAQSGGNSFPDWFEDQPGYIDAGDLYN